MITEQLDITLLFLKGGLVKFKLSINNNNNNNSTFTPTALLLDYPSSHDLSRGRRESQELAIYYYM